MQLQPTAFRLPHATVANQEAAAAYNRWCPGATAKDVENTLFDTWDTTEEYQRDLSNLESGLQVMNGSFVQELPSGGVAVFWAA